MNIGEPVVMDENLKILVLESLFSVVKDPEVVTRVEAIQYEKLHHEFYNKAGDLDWYGCIEELRQHYLEIPLRQDQLDHIHWLCGESCALHFRIQPNHDGYEPGFFPQSLAGIELLPNLQRLSSFPFDHVTDFSGLLNSSVKEIDSHSGLPETVYRQLLRTGVTFS